MKTIYVITLRYEIFGIDDKHRTGHKYVLRHGVGTSAGLVRNYSPLTQTHYDSPGLMESKWIKERPLRIMSTIFSSYT